MSVDDWIEKMRIRTELDRAEKRIMAATLIAELQNYGYSMSASGMVKQFSAPDGMHDDCVIACCLLNWIFSEEPQVVRARQRAGV